MTFLIFRSINTVLITNNSTACLSSNSVFVFSVRYFLPLYVFISKTMQKANSIASLQNADMAVYTQFRLKTFTYIFYTYKYIMFGN